MVYIYKVQIFVRIPDIDIVLYHCFRSVDYKADRRQCLLSVKWSGTIKVSLPCYIKGYTYAEKGTVTIFLNKIYVYYNLIDKLIG